VNKPLAEKHRNMNLRLEMAEARLKTARVERQLQLFNEYDVLKAGNSKKRRVPSPEYQSEDGVLSGYKRGQAVAMGRDLQRNFAGVASALNQFAINVVGRGPKLRLHSESNPGWTEGAAAWFNGTWSKACDFRDDLNFGEMVALLETTIKREGDALLVMDDFGLIPGETPSGKLLWYEADQFVEIDTLPPAWSAYKQHRGVLFDKYGRRVAYAVSASNGAQSVKAEEATIFPAAVARHIKRVWRFNQVRGVPVLLSVAGDAEDLYELQAKEVQTAKAQSTFAGTINKQDAADELDAARGDGTSGTSSGAQYKKLESLMGGVLEYLDPGDELKMLDWQRPALNFVESMDQLLRKAMTAMGLSQTYSLLRVTSSYTAFRGEMLLAWAQFYVDQKFLERHACDWTAEKALRLKYGGSVPADLSMSWDWPRMPAVDPLHEAEAVELLIKTLQTNYSEQLGPEWRTKMTQLAEETKAAKEMGLPTVWEGEKQGLRFDKVSPRSRIGEEA
jgi:capsid protein